MKLFDRIWKPDRSESAAHDLYDALVRQSRNPVFYLEYGVADTLDARVDMIFLHAIVLLRRLGQAQHRTRRMAQSVYDVLFYDLETGLREQGVGDDGVLHKLRAFTEKFTGRVAAYDGALKQEDGADLAAALARNIYRSDRTDTPNVLRLARYTQQWVRSLDAQSIDVLCEGKVEFVPPHDVSLDDKVRVSDSGSDATVPSSSSLFPTLEEQK